MSSSLALAALVLVAVVSPWLFGAVQPWAMRAITATGIVVSVLVLVVEGLRSGASRPASPLWPLLGFVALGLLQLVPMPSALHGLIAPGTHTIWHPAEAAATVVLGAGAHPISLDPDTTVRSLSLIVALGLLAYLAAPALTRRTPVVVALTAVAVCGFALSVYAIFARARFGALLYGRFEVPTPAPFGPFVSKNHFASYVAMAALLTVGLALGLMRDARRRHRDWTSSRQAWAVIAAVVAALAMGLACLASLSRGGAIAFVAGGASLVALYVIRGRRGTGTAVPYVLVVAGVLGLILVVLVPSATHARMQTLDGASFRLGTWRDALRMSTTSPIVGQGLGAFHDAYPRFKQGHGLIRVEHAENDYVETLAETGAVGLGFVLAGAVFLLLGASGRILSRSDPLLGGVGMGAVAALVVLIVHSAVDFNLRIPSNAALGAVVVALTAGAAGLARRPFPRAGGLALALAALVLLAATASLPSEPWTAALDEARRAGVSTTPASRQMRLARSEEDLEAVLRRRPAHAESWIVLAGVRAASGDAASAAALARHAVSLDPSRPALVEAARRLDP